MNYTPRYLGRGSWLSRRDPRLLVLMVVCFVFAAVQVWDIRVLVVLGVVAFAYYRSAGIPFRLVRRQWLFVAFFVVLLVVVNGLIAGGRVANVSEARLHVYFHLPLIGTPISAESVMFALAQLVRFLAMAAVGFPLAFALAPSDFGVSFARLGIPDRFAFAIDLTFRFVPSLAADLQTTIDAQRVRGMELDAGAGGLLGRIRRQAPDPRPDGRERSGRRRGHDRRDGPACVRDGTAHLVRELRFDRADRVILVLRVAMLVITTVAGFTTSTSRFGFRASSFRPDREALGALLRR